MDEKQLELLYKAMSSRFDVGDWNTFRSKMQTPEQRKSFYTAVGGNGFDLGDYQQYESRLAGAVKKKESSSPSSNLSQSGSLPLGSSSAFNLLPETSQNTTELPSELTVGYKASDARVGGDEGQPTKKAKTVAGIYNTLVGSVSRMAGGLGQIGDDVQNAVGINIYSKDKVPIPAGQSMRANVEQVEQLRSPISTKVEEAKRKEFDITDGLSTDDVKGLLFQAPSTILDMVGGALTRGASFGVQAVNDAAEELDNIPEAQNLSGSERMGYIYTNGVIQGALDRFGVNKILKNTGASKFIQKKILNEITQELLSKGEKVTADQIEREVVKKVTSLSSRLKGGTASILRSFGWEGGTEGLEQGLSDLSKLATNQLSGSEIFNEQDITENFVKNIINATTQGGAMGGLFGGANIAMSNNAEALKSRINSAQSQEQIVEIANKINEEVEKGNLTKSEAIALQDETKLKDNILNAEQTKTPDQATQDIQGEKPVAQEVAEVKKEVQPLDVENFAKRIIAGEKMESPEDLQFYDNNKKAIEDYLQQQAPKEQLPDVESKSGEEYIKDKVIVSGASGGFRVIDTSNTPNEGSGTTADVRRRYSDEKYEIILDQETKNREDLFKDINFYDGAISSYRVKDKKNGKTYLVVGVASRKYGKGFDPDRDGQIFVSVEDTGNLPENILPTLKKRAIDEVNKQAKNPRSTFEPVRESIVDKINADYEQSLKTTPKSQTKEQLPASTETKSEPSKQEKVNDLVDRVNAFNKKPKNAAGRNQEINDIKVAANELGLKFDDRAGKLVNEKGKKVQKRSVDAPSKEAKGFNQDDYSPETKNHFNTLKSNPNTLFGLPIKGRDGRQLTQKQLQEAVKSVESGKPNVAAQAIFDYLENAVNDGGIEIEDKVTGQRVTIPIDEYFAEFKEPVKPLTDEEIMQLNWELTEDSFNFETDENGQEILHTETQLPSERKTATSSDATSGGEETARDTPKEKEKITEPPKPPVEEDAAVVGGDGNVEGITHAANEVRREERKLPPYQKNPTTEEALMAEAEQKLKDGYDVEDLFNRMEKGEMPTPVENFIRKIYIATLDAEIAKNPTDELLAKQKRFVELGDIANSKLGLNLWSLKGSGSPLNTISDFYVAKMEALGKDKLTDEQKEEVKKQFDEVKKTESDAADKISKLEEENAKLKAELEVKKAKASTKKQTKDFKKEREDLKQSIKDKWNKAADDNTLSAVAVPYAKQLIAIAPDVAKLMKSYIEEGVTEFGDIIKRLHADIQEIEPRATEKDVADIISGQYDTPKETKGDLQRKLKSIKNKRSEEAIKIIAKIKSGDFAKVEKPVSWVENKELKKKFPKEYNEALDAIKRKEDARHEFDIALLRDEMARRTIGQKLSGWLSKAAGTVKAITTGIDDSAVAIQTYVSLLRRPRTGARAVYEHFRQGFSKNAQRKFDRWLAALHSSPDFADMVEDGLDVTEPASLKEREKEEIFNNRFSGTIKIKGKEIKLIDAPLKPFERAFTTLGNVTRVTAYRNISRKYREEGYTREKDPELFKSLARRLNEQTGRGKINEYIEQANKVVTLGIWSPRLMAAKFNQLGISDLASLFIPGTKGYYRQLHPKERAAAIRDIAQFAVTVSALTYGLALAAGGDVDDDPLSSTFMDVKLPNGKSYNFTGGFSGYIRAIAQFAKGKKHKDGKDQKLNSLDVGSRFFRGKVPPLTGAALNVFSGKNYMGQETSVGEEIINLAPISVRGITQQIQNDGGEAFITQGIPTFFGFNVKNEKDYEKPLKTFKIYQQGKSATNSREATQDEIKKVNEETEKIFEKDLQDTKKNKGWGYNRFNEITIDDDAIVKMKRVEWEKLTDDQKKELESRIKTSARNKAKKLIKY